MKALLRSLRRARGRVVASVLALGLAVGAMGVFAIPTVASGTLRDMGEQDQLAHIGVATSPIDEETVRSMAELPGVTALEARTVAGADLPNGDTIRVVGFDKATQVVNLVNPTDGRFPNAGEAIVSAGVAQLGETVVVAGTQLDVVGVGGTTWWSDVDAVYVTEAQARDLVGQPYSQVFARLDNPTEENLDAAVADMRSLLAQSDAYFVEAPDLLPNGEHPIEADLTQISTMIGLLGVVAGLVALVLLASTSSALITDRSQEVAVMRALGSPKRPLRRRLRRMAFATAAAGLVIGIPLGVSIANFVARMILERFVGITPGLAVSWPVVGASVAFALVGSRLVAARSARRVTKAPLAEALRDRTPNSWGRRPLDRALSHVPTGGLLARLSLRSIMRTRARSLSTVAQIAAGTGAAVVVASLALSIADFNEGESEPWSWESAATAANPGLPFDPVDVSEAGLEPAINVEGTHNGWEVDVLGLVPGTQMLDTQVEDGRWIAAGDGVVVSKGFADHQGIGVGDRLDVELAAATVSYEVVGLHRSRARDIYIPLETLAEDLGTPGGANMVFSNGPAIPALPVPADVVTIAELSAEDTAARQAILAIFSAIGIIVAGVAALGVASLLAVTMYERRHEMATLLAIGGRQRDIVRVLLAELVALALLGSALGAVGGWFGASFIMGAFERANAVDLGMVFASNMIAPATVGALAIVTVIALGAARGATRVPAAVTLRSAA